MNANREMPAQRVLDAFIEVCAAEGYQGATIARVITHARVSRRTFYQHFTGRSDCLRAAAAEIETQLLQSAEAAVQEQTQDATGAMIAALVAFAQKNPASARVLMSETMAAGPVGLAARDHAVDRLTALLEDRGEVDTPAPGAPAGALIGAVFRMLASRLRRRELDPERLTEDLVNWARSYAEPGAAEPAVRPTTISTRTGSDPRRAAALRAPPPAGARRGKQPSDAVSADHRLRIIFAVAEVVRRDGYAEATVTAITRTAGVDGRIFYSLFADKNDALRALHEFAFQHAWTASAGAFSTAPDWPYRLWEAGRALTEFLDQNATLTYASLIEDGAGGPQTTRRFEELLAGFTIFLREGYQYEPAGERSPPSRAALDAIAQTGHEMLYRHARTSEQANMAMLLGSLAYVCLTPFLGAARAGALIAQLASSQSADEDRGR
jgi:AcrR family transcriptional regulator